MLKSTRMPYSCVSTRNIIDIHHFQVPTASNPFTSIDHALAHLGSLSRIAINAACFSPIASNL